MAFLTLEQANNKDFISKLVERMIQAPVRHISVLDGGKISYNYEVNHQWICKLPSHRSIPENWCRQSQYMPVLQKKLKYQVPIPKVQSFKLKQGQIIGCFYPKISGQIWPRALFDKRPYSQKIAYFEEVTDALIQLHSIQPDDLPVQCKSYLDNLVQFLFEDSEEKQTEFKKYIQSSFQKAEIPLSQDTLCHADLHSNNVVLDSKGRLVGVLDWDSLSLGAPFMEFHPPLYEEKDLNLFHQIYQEKAKIPADKKAVDFVRNLYKNIGFLFTFGFLSKKIKIKRTPCFVTRKNPSKHLGINTDCWNNFGRN